MGSRGPLPMSAEVLRARGSKQAPKAARPAAFGAGVPSCPPHLAGEARAEWKRVTKELHAAGVLCKADRAVLAAYCEAWGDYLAASAAVAGCLKADPLAGLSRAIQLGYVKQKKETGNLLARLAAQLGCTPAARVRVKAQEAPKEAEVATGKRRFFDPAGVT